MNDELIFVKTASGEDAVRDRTRLVQRNLRMVLILVDGLTKVSALKQKAGDPAMIETALAELERIGLIESIESRGSRQASAVTEALSIATVGSEPSAADAYEDFPTVDTVFEEVAPSTSTVGAETVIPTDVQPPSKALFVRPSGASEGWFTRMRNRWHQVREERAYEKAYGTPSVRESIAPPSSRRLGRKLKLMPIISGALVVAAIIGAVRVVLYPYGEYRPAVEAHLSKMLGDEVSVGSIELVFVPAPTFVLQKVSVGRNAAVTAEQISISPNPGIVLGGPPIRTVQVDGLLVRESALGTMAKWFLPGTMGEFTVEDIQVGGLAVDLGWTQLHSLSGTIRPSPIGTASFIGRGEGGEFQFEVAPSNAGLAISVKAGQWVLPVNPPLQVADLDFTGTLAAGGLVVTKVDARAFDGVLTGKGTLSWDSSPRMALDLTLKHVAAVKLLEALHAPALLNGELNGQVQYSTSAPSVRWLGPNAKATGAIGIVHGSLKRIDLASALRTSGQRSGPNRGGETGFEDFSGKFSLDAGSARISDVRLSSGLMLASGQATLARDTGLIAGTANVEMRGSARAAKAALSISGKASDPELRTAR